VFEQAFPLPVDGGPILAAAKDFHNADCSYRLETAWDLWQYDQSWKLEPSPVALCCLGPQFEEDLGENLRIEFGIDTHFLPQPDLPDNFYMTQSNIKEPIKVGTRSGRCTECLEEASVDRIRREFRGEVAGGALSGGLTANRSDDSNRSTRLSRGRRPHSRRLWISIRFSKSVVLHLAPGVLYGLFYYWLAVPLAPVSDSAPCGR